MTKISRKRGTFSDLVFEVDLSGYGKTNADIEEIYFSVKDDEADADDSILLKQETTGGISYSGTTLLTVRVDFGDGTEYDKMANDRTYKAGLFIKFTGDPTADENVSTTFTFVVTQDFLRA